MHEIILCKLGEVVLKGLNRHSFEAKLMSNIRRRTTRFGRFKIYSRQSTIYVEPLEESCDMDGAYAACRQVFGIIAIARAMPCEKDKNAIFETARTYLGQALTEAKSFKVETRRSDKTFPMGSIQLSQWVGGALHDAFPHLKVDVHHPELTVHVEVREDAAYVHAPSESAAGGLPIGMGGHAVSLLSGGIDSPVSSYMIAKRGVQLEMIHFASPPYTSQMARDKVLQLARELHCGALVTGENLGQVASQTMGALRVSQDVTDLPILRPLIGMDKEEIVRLARKIGTFDTSILPYEDCCTVFTPRHPKTKPNVEEVREMEQALDVEGLCRRAMEGRELVKIKYYDKEN